VARPKSEDKRNAILDAATDLFAERGLAAAPTAEISRRADVAEGTLFTYFETKDDLINSLYPGSLRAIEEREFAVCRRA
jgi:AcrR family transcriptional regulator